MYNLEVSESLKKTFTKIAKKNVSLKASLDKKIREILEDPYRYKPLHFPLQNKRRVHIGSFVLLFSILENEKTIRLIDFDHHDNIYK
jgi:YafQ family addiction module toxin component